MAFGALIVDDDDDIRLLMRLIIDAANDGLFVHGDASSGAEAVSRVDELDPDVIVLDEMMPGMNGLEVAGVIRERRPGQRIILCSAYLDDDLRARAQALGITICLTKEEMPALPEAMRAMAGGGA